MESLQAECRTNKFMNKQKHNNDYMHITYNQPNVMLNKFILFLGKLLLQFSVPSFLQDKLMFFISDNEGRKDVKVLKDLFNMTTGSSLSILFLL